MQKNKISYILNQLSIEQFAFANNRDIFFFSVEYYWLKRDSDNLVQYEILFKAKYGESNCPEPDPLIHCVKIPATFLTKKFTGHWNIHDDTVIVWVLCFIKIVDSFLANKIIANEIISIK